MKGLLGIKREQHDKIIDKKHQDTDIRILKRKEDFYDSINIKIQNGIYVFLKYIFYILK